MVKIYNTAQLQPNTKIGPDYMSWIYNGLDCCVTAEVRGRLRQDLAADTNNVRETYDTAMKKLAPVGFMCLTGLRVDEVERQNTLAEYRRELRKLNDRFDYMMEETVGFTINWRSPLQLRNLFYDTFALKPVRKRNAKGFFSPTVNADALERFQAYYYIQPYSRIILKMRELAKKISFLETAIDEDGRIRTSLNIAGTDTGRFSSAFSAFGTGTNLQNVEETLRRPFIADPDYIFVNVDLEQADARNVGARIWQIFYDSHGPEAAGKYLDACESGDLHTMVCSMAWQELDWPDPWNLKKARVIADAIAYRSFSYRDMSKKLGHGTNYFGLPPTMARHTKAEPLVIANFQQRYFKAFPLIGNFDKKLDRQDWHSWVYNQLRTVGYLNNLFGRRRIFFDRYKAPETLRAAIAYDPQSSTGEFLDRGWLQLWDNMPEARLHLPVHDSILFSLPFEGVNELVPKALKLLQVFLELKGGRMYTIPLEAKVGWNWANRKVDKKTGLVKNEYGLRVWDGKEEREQPKVKTRLKHYLR